MTGEAGGGGAPLTAAYVDEFDAPAGYLEFAATGPVSHRVRRVLDGALQDIGAAGEPVVAMFLPRYQAAVRRVAGFLGVPEDRATAAFSTSEGLFQIAFGLIPTGGNVVVPAGEFPANLYPWVRAEALGGPEVRLLEVPDGRLTPGVLSAAVDRDTRAIALSLVDFQTGFRVDLEALREAAGDALLVVDAIQGLGAVRQQLAPADVMVAGGQKWMRAGWGSGVMAVSDRALDRLYPVLTGWLGVEDPMVFGGSLPHPPASGAARFQTGTPPILGGLQVGAAIDVIDMVGTAAIEEAIRRRLEEFDEVLASAGAEVLAPWASPAERAGILCFRLPGAEPAATTAHLVDAGLIVSHRGDWVRLSPHATTPPEAAGMLAEALGVPA